MEQQLLKGAYCESVCEHIKRFFSYEDLDNFLVFQQFSEGNEFPFEELQNKIRSENYRNYIEETVGSNELSKDHMISFYGKQWCHDPLRFEFSLGDKIIINRMVGIMTNIMMMESKEKTKMLKKSNKFPVDERPIAQSEQELRHLKTLILKRKTQSAQYHQIKNQIKIQLLTSKAISFCPLCPEKITLRKYFKRGDRSYWNLANLYRHLDNCLVNSSSLETSPALAGYVS